MPLLAAALLAFDPVDREGRFTSVSRRDVAPCTAQMLPSVQMTEFIVRAGQTTRLQLRADTGIR